MLVKTGWVLMRKGEVVRARLVATQISDGVKTDDLYCPAPRAAAHRIVMVRAMEKGWDLITADVTAAFLNAELTGDEEIYLIPPKSEGLEGKLWKAEKAIYGLRRSPRDFYEHFGKKAAKFGWQRVAAEPQLLRNPKYKDALMSAHTDDLLITAGQYVRDSLGRNFQ